MSNEVAVQKQDKATSLVKNLEASFSTALPTHVTKEHFSRALLTQFRRTPKLMQCTQQSIGGAVLTAAQLGLMLGVNGAGWLVPFKDEAVLVIGYQGMVDLCYRSDRVDSVSADVVCENDKFDYEQGLNQRLKHIPELKGPRGPAYAAYAIANIRGSDRPVYVVMNQQEIMDVKKASPAASKSESPWNGPFEYEMWKKTALRRLTKLLPKSVELASALEFENKQEERMREIEASVIDDDPLTPGRHNSRAKAEIATEPEQEEQPKSKERPESYTSIYSIYDGNEDLIDSTLKEFGLPIMPDLVWQDLTQGQLKKLDLAANTVRGKFAEKVE